MNTPATTWPFRCSVCGRSHPGGVLHYRCPTCNGPFDLDRPIRFAPRPVEPHASPLERYRESFFLPQTAPWISLGEGGTPLQPALIDERTVYFKCEHLNPTGSFKDRGSCVLISALAAGGIAQVLEDSSGNAGASLAAYAARAGIRARVLVPEGASPRKKAQIAAYGAELVPIEGPRTAVAEAAQREAAAGATYASHAWIPLGLAGMATAAFEIVEQLGHAPGAVVLPVGQGTLLLGVARGFEAMRAASAVETVPRLIAGQAAACAPIWAVHQGGGEALGWVREGETRAEGIRILHPLRGDAVLAAIEGSGGTVVAVDEPSIEDGERQLGHRGFYVEPTSAVVWGALAATLRGLPDPVVVILTGSGLKSPDRMDPKEAGNA